MFCSANSNALMKSIRTVLPAVNPHWVGDGFLVRPVFADGNIILADIINIVIIIIICQLLLRKKLVRS